VTFSLQAQLLLPGCRQGGMSISTPTLVAARSRAHGTAAALWHAVEVHRPATEVDAACELTVCGSLARVDPEQRWPLAAADVCPDCAAA
jgi:hypothetical protein